MSNETFLISMAENNDLSQIAVDELRQDLAAHPMHQRLYEQIAAHPGNQRQYAVKQVKPQVSPLTNKKVLFLGSSVTFGFGALGESFVDYLWRRDGLAAIKDAENGTTLTDYDSFTAGDSYVARFKKELKRRQPEALVLQLSTNDTKRGPGQLGRLPTGNYFDTKTITGALSYVIFEAKKHWHCPILVYTNPYFENDLYSKMVQRAKEVTAHFQVALLDLYHDPALKKQGALYMVDQIHPTRAGYLKKWLPRFEKKLFQILN